MDTNEKSSDASYSIKEMFGQLLETVRLIDAKLDGLKDTKADRLDLLRLEQRITDLERTGSVQAKEALELSNRNGSRLTALETLQLGRLAEDVRALLLDVQKFKEQNALTPMYLEQWNEMRHDIQDLRQFRDTSRGIDAFRRWVIPIISSGVISFGATILVIYSAHGKI